MDANVATIENSEDQRSITEETSGTDAAGPSQERLPDIFSLDILCFENILKWLSFWNLRILRQTCKQFQKDVDHYIEMNYPSRSHLLMFRDRLEDSQHVENEHDFINGKKIIYFESYDLNDNNINLTKDIETSLGQVETIIVNIRGDHPLNFLKYCTQLKYLTIFDYSLNINSEFLLHRYPALVGVKMTLINQNMKSFFELNPNIRIWSTDCHSLFRNQLWIRKSSIKLDQLIVNTQKNCCNLLKHFYDKGFYRRLHLRIDAESKANTLNRVSKLKQLEKLCVWVGKNLIFPPFPHLKELIVKFMTEKHCIMLPYSFPNLESIEFHSNYFDSHFTYIRNFIRYSRKLKHIKLPNLETFHKIDFVSLNELRKLLPGAEKVTIFVIEDLYLEYKWTRKTNLSMIQLKRLNMLKNGDMIPPRCPLDDTEG